MRALGAASTPGLHFEGSAVNQCLNGAHSYGVEFEIENLFTCPPENPTATTPSSLPADRNLGEMVEGEVIAVLVDIPVPFECRFWARKDACTI